MSDRSGSMRDPLSAFDPTVSRWFRTSIGEPSEIQAGVWRALEAGSHVLACAPTGSGKTLAAFLGALNSLIAGEYPLCRVSVLYVSPLKALNSDIRRNLVEPLAAMRALRDAEDKPFPPIAVAVRSGDTSQAERRDFVKNPSEILATTPESLALLLNSPRARDALARVKLVVLDEIHALEPNKRGAFLMAQLERLEALAGPFRRVALSATVADPASMAAYVAGFGADGAPRPITVVRAGDDKRYSLDIRYPPPLPSLSAVPDPESVSRWTALIDAFLHEVAGKRTTLIFVNSRRQAEKIAFLMNERSGEEIAWAHHGSLSREVRANVEERLKRGLLKVVVATASLELGIDIGSLDQVLLAGSPPGASSALQRIGRAGHRLGEESRAVLFPLHPFDLLSSLAVARDLKARRLDAEARPEAPLDVLAQLVLACVSLDPWREDDLYRLIRRAAPFARLARSDFDLVLDMLRGRFDSARLPALASRLDREAPPGVLKAKDGVLPLLYASGGVIPDRGSFALVLAETRAPLGELDEEFVWERRIGDGFSLGTRAWRIVGIDDRAVAVKPSDRGIQIVPFWRAENQWRSEDSMASLLAILDEFETAAASGGESVLASEPLLDGEGRAELLRFLRDQRNACPLPLSARVVVEAFPGPGGQGSYSFLHTLRGGRLNAALGIALRAAADRRYGEDALEFFWDDSGILASFTAAEDLGLNGKEAFRSLFEDLNSEGLASCISRALESTGLFGASFRENAGRALLLPKASFGKRTPLWMTRLRSKRLYEAVRGFADFPIVQETWRSCLKDILDPEGAARLVSEVVSGRVDLAFHESAAPSAFARGSMWIASDSFMYRRDDGSAASATDEEVIRRLLSADSEVPSVSSQVLSAVLAQVKRLHRDYAPRGKAELADWLDERLIIERSEWERLLAIGSEEGEGAIDADELRFSDASAPFAASPDLRSRPRDDAELLSHWLRYEGPVSADLVRSLFGESGSDLLQDLVSDQSLVKLRVDDGPPLICDAELASRLLRADRASRRRSSAAAEAPLSRLQALAARKQGVAQSSGAAPAEASVEALRAALEPLLGCSAPLELWEREILPARTSYLPYHLDLLMDRYPLLWYGAGGDRIGFSLEDELSYADLPPEGDLSPAAAAALERLRADRSDAGADAAALAELARAGLATADRFAAAKRILSPAAAAPEKMSSDLPFGAPRPKGAFPSRSRWERSRSGAASLPGERWRPLSRPEAADSLDRESALRERARRLLLRWGMLCRSLAVLDEGAPAWTDLFRALRLMEFSGEVVGGRFFSGLDELQFRFASDIEAEASGQAPAGDAALYCLCARDPASLCGLAPLAHELDLPPRAAGNHLVWRGSELILVSRSNGRDLSFRAGDPVLLSSALSLLCRRLTGRAVDPVRTLVVETVDGARSQRSPWAELLREIGFVPALKGLEYIVRRT